jgi:glycosyltransferase involved in cell wall biosynthesis
LVLTQNAYSVVIPAFNAETTIAEAIGSVLQQSVPPITIVVVDDGSSDGTATIASAFGTHVRVTRQDNLGPGAATSRGLSEVETPFVATLDADDLWLPTKAERQLALLESSSAIAAVFGHLQLFASDPADPRNGRVSAGWSRTTLMMPTATFARVGAMADPPGRRGELVDWLARARDTGEQLTMMDEVVALRRIRPGSLSDGRDIERDRGYLHAAHNALQRRRSGRAPK